MFFPLLYSDEKEKRKKKNLKLYPYYDICRIGGLHYWSPLLKITDQAGHMAHVNECGLSEIESFRLQLLFCVIYDKPVSIPHSMIGFDLRAAINLHLLMFTFWHPIHHQLIITQTLLGTIRFICGPHVAYPMGGYERRSSLLRMRWSSEKWEVQIWKQSNHNSPLNCNLNIIQSVGPWYSGNQVDVKECCILMMRFLCQSECRSCWYPMIHIKDQPISCFPFLFFFLLNFSFSFSKHTFAFCLLNWNQW